MAEIRTPTAVIASGASLSGAIYVGSGKLVSIQMPAAWTSAGLSFAGSADGVTFNPIYDGSGAEVTFAADAAEMIAIDRFEGAIWLKVRSGTVGSAVTQGADRSLVCVIQKFPLV